MSKTIKLGVKTAHIEFADDIVITLTKLKRTSREVGGTTHYIVDTQVYNNGDRVFQAIENPFDTLQALLMFNGEAIKTYKNEYQLVLLENESIEFRYKFKFADLIEWKIGATLSVRQREAFIYWFADFIGVKKRFIKQRLQDNVLLTEKKK